MTLRATAPWIERLPLLTDRPLIAAGIAMLFVAAAYVARLVAAPMLPPGFPFLTFFPAVILSSALFGTPIGVLSGVVSGILAWFFFIGEAYRFDGSYGALAAMAFYALVIGTDILIIHWMQHANAKLARERELNRSLAETRELLFRELQHRVSNNLQVAAGLVLLQKRQVKDPDARAALDEASGRLALIGRISRQLYDAGGSTRQMGEFLHSLCQDVIEASGRPGIECRVIVGEVTTLSSDSAIPLALIVAEAIANAIEHGFAGRDRGAIEVELSRAPDGGIAIEVRDDGRGLPDGFDIDNSGSLGLRIARTLAAQMQGSFQMLQGEGAVARLTLPG